MGGVKLDDFAQLKRDLRALDPELKKALKKELRSIVDDAASWIRAVIPTGSPKDRNAGKARDSIRAVGSGDSTKLVAGRRTVAHYGWLDFGSRSPRSGFVRGEAGPWSQSGAGPKGGRYIYPTLNRHYAEIGRRVDEVRDKAVKAAKLET